MSDKTTICPKCGHQEFVSDEVDSKIRTSITNAFLDGSKFGLEQARKIFNDDKRGMDKDQVLKDAQPYIEALVSKHNQYE